MRGKSILISAPNSPRGVFREVIVGAGLTLYPGTVLQYDYDVALEEGVETGKAYTPGANGNRPLGPLWIMWEGPFGNKVTDPVTEGDRAFVYCPLAGEQFNMLVKNLAGTADDHPLGRRFIIENGTGLLIATTSTPQCEPFTLKEIITDPTANTLAWCDYNGY